jgi:hypothetical protein
MSNEDKQNASPIAMAAQAVAAARDRFTRSGREATVEQDTQAQPAVVATHPGLNATPAHAQSTSPPATATGPAGRVKVQPGRPASAAPRKARLRLVRVDPWSVMKTAFLLSIAFGIMCVVAVFVVWSVLSAANVFGSINTSIEQIIESEFHIEEYVGIDRVLPFTMLVAVVDVVLLTAIATLGAFLYNLAAGLLGGLEVTLAEEPH